MKKEKILIMAISDKEKREIADYAKKNEMSMSEFIRHLFREFKIREDLKHAD